MTTGLIEQDIANRDMSLDVQWASAAELKIPRPRAVERAAASAEAPLALVDRVSLAYLSIAMVILSAHLAGWHQGPESPRLVAAVVGAHLIVGAFAVGAPWLRRSGSPLLSLLGDWYPLLTMMLLYASVGVINRGIGDGHSFDELVMRWDRIVFGQDIAYTLMRGEPNLALSWLLHFCYLAYFPLLIVGPAVLWVRGDRPAAQRCIFATTLAFLACYAAFLLFPVAGPAYVWPTPEIAAASVWPARAARAIFFHGDAFGSGFPSAHVATSLVATTFAVRGWPRLAWLTVPPTLGILGAVVYSQIHYGTDAVAGLVLAALVIVAVGWLAPCYASLCGLRPTED